MIIDINHRLTIVLGSGVARAVEHLLLTPLSGPGQTVKDLGHRDGGHRDRRPLHRCLRQSRAARQPGQARGGGRHHRPGRASKRNDRNGVLGRIAGEPVPQLYRRQTELTSPDPRVLESFAGAERHGAARIALYHNLMARVGEVFGVTGTEGPRRASRRGADGQQQSQGGAEAPAPDAAAMAHAFIGAARALGLPARYVTGYLLPEEGGAAAFHAWTEAYDDGLGWIGFDPSLDLAPPTATSAWRAASIASPTLPIRLVPEPVGATAATLTVIIGAQ